MSECFLAPRYTRFIAFTSKKRKSTSVLSFYVQTKTKNENQLPFYLFSCYLRTKTTNENQLPFYRFSFYVQTKTKNQKRKSTSVLSFFVLFLFVFLFFCFMYTKSLVGVMTLNTDTAYISNLGLGEPSVISF